MPTSIRTSSRVKADDARTGWVEAQNDIRKRPARAGERYAIIHGSLEPIAADSSSIEDVAKANAIGLGPVDITVNPSTRNTTPPRAPG